MNARPDEIMSLNTVQRFGRCGENLAEKTRSGWSTLTFGHEMVNVIVAVLFRQMSQLARLQPEEVSQAILKLTHWVRGTSLFTLSSRRGPRKLFQS